MKRNKLKKIIAIAAVITMIGTAAPIKASAEWIQNSQNQWSYTEGGNKVSGWKQVNGVWYHFDANGTMQTNWVKAEDSKWYYMNSDGSMKVGWLKDTDGKWYNLSSDGSMETGWLQDTDGKWYFTDSSGAMQTGAIEVQGKVYVLAESGAMQTGSTVIDGKTYAIDANGAIASDMLPTVNKTFTNEGKVISSNETSTSNGQTTAQTAQESTTTTSQSSTGSTSSSKNSSSSSSVTSNSIEITGNDTMNINEFVSTFSTYTAKVKDSNGNEIAGKTVTWSLKNPVIGVSIDKAAGTVKVATVTVASNFTIVATSADGSTVGEKVVDLTHPMVDNNFDYKVHLDSTHKVITFTFYKNIINNKSSINELKNSITVSTTTGSEVYASLGTNDTVEINGKELKITFEQELPTADNWIFVKIAPSTLKDVGGNVWADRNLTTINLNPNTNPSNEEFCPNYLAVSNNEETLGIKAEATTSGVVQIATSMMSGDGEYIILNSYSPGEVSIQIQDSTAEVHKLYIKVDKYGTITVLGNDQKNN